MKNIHSNSTLDETPVEEQAVRSTSNPSSAPSLLEFSEDSLKTWLLEQGEQAFRASQILSWAFKPGVVLYVQFRNIPASLKKKLADSFTLRTTKTREIQYSDWAVKLLLELSDSETVECVLLKDDRNNLTVCLSTQVGCAMGCLFCATGQTLTEKAAPSAMLQTSGAFADEETPCTAETSAKSSTDSPVGTAETATNSPAEALEPSPDSASENRLKLFPGRSFVRNLTVAEIIEQVLYFQDLLPEGERISHLVVMGMGEPTQNLDNLLPALDIISDRLEIGARKITISTVGIPAGIRRIADCGRQYHLAVSLHAPTDELRSQIVPMNRNIGIAATLKAADEFFEKTGRRVTYEYVLLGGTNDSVACAERLAQLLSGKNALVNVIPYNEAPGLPFKRPRPKAIDQFVQTLEARNVQVHLRKEKGGDIDAACGQLRRRKLED